MIATGVMTARISDGNSDGAAHKFELRQVQGEDELRSNENNETEDDLIKEKNAG